MSSTKEIDLASPICDIVSPRAALRSSQMRAWSSAVMAR